MRNILLLTGLLALSTQAFALESTASGALDTQMSWNALSAKIEVTTNNLEITNILVNQLAMCAKNGSFYAPGQDGADPKTGCLKVPTAPKITVDYSQCMQADDSTNDHNGLAGKKLGMSINSGNAGYLYCHKDYVLIGTNTKSVGSALCCKLKIE